MRKRMITAVVACVAVLAGCGRTVTVTNIDVVPEPVFLLQKEGTYTLHRSVAIATSGLGQNSPTAKHIMNSLRHLRLRPSLVSRSEESDIELILNDTVNPELGSEGYLIEVRQNGITLSANTEQGLLYAHQSLMQMIPPDAGDHAYSSIVLPECTILDHPRFGWRGALLDACGYHFTVKQMKRYLDLMACYKMNRLLWHVADSVAWRLPVASPWHDSSGVADGAAPYSADDIAEVVAYASDLGIAVVPGVEMPPAAMADSAWAATLTAFLAQHFPSPHMHLGDNPPDDAAWHTMEQLLQQAGREAMFWDIARRSGDDDGEVPAAAPWRRGTMVTARSNREPGQATARAGGQVVMCPEEYCRLDIYQASPRYQPAASQGLLTLAKAYSFDPAPQGTNKYVEQNIAGGQLALWTAHIGSLSQADYMLLPRLLATSECLWSPQKAKNWSHFRKKVELQKTRLASKGYAYCEGSFTPLFRATRIDDRTMNIAIETEVPSTYIFYTTDGSTPDRNSPVYLGPINLRRGTHIKILPVYKDREQDSVYEFVIN